MIEAVIKNDGLSWDMQSNSMEDYSPFELAMDAVELLAHKNSTASIPLTMRLLREMALEDDEFLAACGPDLIGAFGPEAAGAWLRNVRPTRGTCTVESVILDGIGILAQEHVSLQKVLTPQIVQLLASANKSSPELNGQLVAWHLVEIDGSSRNH